MKRRDFVSLVGVGGVVPFAIAACDVQRQETSTLSPPRSDGFQAIGTVSDLNTRGQLLAEDATVGKVLVIPDPNDSNQLLAVNPTCPHAGCTVDWRSEQTAFVCPCHGSRFAANGELLNGPARNPITAYAAKIDGDTVLVKLS